MSNKITIKTGTSAPSNGALSTGEFGFDTSAGKLYLGTGAGAPIEIGTGEVGPTGPAGPPNILSIGTITSGIEASATISGTSPSQILNLVLPKGDKGDTGDTGATGPTGPQGIQGIQGIQGVAGLDGDDGLSAYEVAVANGFVGTELQWLTSLIGETGAVGPTGPQGIQGETGATGPTGSPNVLSIGTVTSGVEASATISGTSPSQILNLVLPKGDKGDTGPTGATGAQGIQGEVGPPNIISIGLVESGAIASVTISGTTPSQILNFVLPKGDTGSTGPTGPQGIQGPQGLQGIQGATGATGPTGATYSADYVGATAGAAGVHGLVPAAASSQSVNFLRGDGTWATVVTDIPDATTTVSGKVNTGTQSFAGVKTFSDITDATSTITGAVRLAGGLGVAKSIHATDVWGANWNDYAEFRQGIDDQFLVAGTCVCENGQDQLVKSTKRRQAGAYIISDTFGFSIGQTEIARIPIAVSGRVLACTHKNRNKFKVGQPVCAAPDGTVDKMTRLEAILFPDRIIGTVSCIPTYSNWGEKNVEVNERIWIYIK